MDTTAADPGQTPVRAHVHPGCPEASCPAPHPESARLCPPGPRHHQLRERDPSPRPLLPAPPPGRGPPAPARSRRPLGAPALTRHGPRAPDAAKGQTLERRSGGSQARPPGRPPPAPAALPPAQPRGSGRGPPLPARPRALPAFERPPRPRPAVRARSPAGLCGPGLCLELAFLRFRAHRAKEVGAAGSWAVAGGSSRGGGEGLGVLAASLQTSPSACSLLLAAAPAQVSLPRGLAPGGGEIRRVLGDHKQPPLPLPRPPHTRTQGGLSSLPCPSESPVHHQLYISGPGRTTISSQTESPSVHGLAENRCRAASNWSSSDCGARVMCYFPKQRRPPFF